MLKINLLREVQRRHPDGVADMRRGSLLYEVGPRNRLEEALAIIEPAEHEHGQVDRIVIDLAGIAVVTPSAASAVAGAAAGIIQRHRIPVMFENAQVEVLKGLRECKYLRDNPMPPLLIADEGGRQSYVGAFPDRWQSLLKSLPESGASASVFAGKVDASKRDVNKFSVYLQELYNNGLARREKVPGSERGSSERGWTYVYYPVFTHAVISETDRDMGTATARQATLERCHSR